MDKFWADSECLFWRQERETVCIQGWGRDSLRIQATLNTELPEMPWALLAQEKAQTHIEIKPQRARLQNGLIQAELGINGRISFLNTASNVKLLEESVTPSFSTKNPRHYQTRGGGLYKIQQQFAAQPGERFYGLGQHTHGLLDQKGCVIDLVQHNTQVSIPFLVSNRNYGFLWNNPALGRVELGRECTRWVAEATRGIDYYITTATTYAGILENYSQATGLAPQIPDWALGFWQSKLRYCSQAEVLAVAREYKQRGLPLSVLVIDALHWPRMGDWRFDLPDWPDPAAMQQELKQMGIELMVSVWPTISPNSENYLEMAQQGLLINDSAGTPVTYYFVDVTPPGRAALHWYDATHPEARRLIWEKHHQNYYHYGIKAFWLDAGEPEVAINRIGDLRYNLGDDLEVGNIYPMLHAQAFSEGLKKQGESEIITLNRSAWAGSQRYGAAVWSGDIPSTFEALQAQVRAGLNMAMSGIPWWTTDMGGFMGGDIRTPYFQELIVRWFQYGVFCPLFRLHGYRQPFTSDIKIGNELSGGGPNEVWSFGETAYDIIKEMLFLRERMRPYLREQMRRASLTGLPPMRPLFFDFSADHVSYDMDDEFLLGADVLVAPVLEHGARHRRVYLPSGVDWQHAWTGEHLQGGGWHEAQAPLDTIPVYYRSGARPW
jgi:alpha-D-xyloside xylohydrolase